MLPSPVFLRKRLEQLIACRAAQGHDTAGMLTELKRLPDRYDVLTALAERLRNLPLLKDWPYEEPNDLDGIWAACDPGRPRERLRDVSGRDIPSRIETAFLSAVCGCMLGKPLEVNPTLAASWNPWDEACGAAIRVDAYGYACPGMPALAAELAWRDSSFTHRRTGIYGRRR
jgi:hypothetical protein